MPEPHPPWTRRWPRALLQLLLPSSCALCGGACAGVVCAPCRDHFCLPVTNRCARCANPLPEAGTCGRCLSYPPAYDATIFAVDYAPPLDHLVLQLKFSARLPLAPWFAEMLRDAILARSGLPLPELICPVPLGPARLVERGFNQALEIARPLAAALGVTLHPALAQRQTDTRAQSGVSPHERAENIRGAFGVSDPDLVEGRHVGIVDDVMTSGSTLEELAATFKRFGAARVTNLVFARTPPHA
ncbi:amidophosphoribosyltransferase [Massilia sp. WF1]|uniref:ComF family protein n=1 Tax=unclassified Massilia TaxID=2609279 RepID=UPI00068B25A4|nr:MULTISPECIES: ComF family protein [unclassified Massilia]ALK95813.1 amidophosphoribosyltransferase [Massilia sp. WG5]KNZ67968.1 amidophosphoribosyltransferase [Massilia sp. WF1]